MHVKNYPQYYVRGDERRAVYFTADVRDLKVAGWELESSVAPEPVEPEPETVAAKPVELPKLSEKPVKAKPDIEAMTKNELVEYAAKRGIQLQQTSLKSDLIDACKDLK
jgi:hypothetical protein